MTRIFTLSIICLALSLSGLLSLSGCSSYLDPDIAYKGIVDEAFLKSLSRGEISTTFVVDDHFIYEMDYELYGTNKQKWEDMTDRLVGAGLPLPSKITITQGRSWREMKFNESLQGMSKEEMKVADCWYTYKQETKFNKNIYIACLFEFNPSERTLIVNNNEFFVEKAEGNEMIISLLGNAYSTKEGKFQPVSKCKTILILKKNNFEEIDIDNIIFFESYGKALLGMVKILQEYYGDSMEINGSDDLHTVNLLELENNIIKTYID